KNSTVMATGKVEVTQGDTILLADTLIYDRQKDSMRAVGNVSMLEPSGHVYFAEQVELRNDIKMGVLQHFRARLSDNSLFAASHAKRTGDGNIELFKAVYS